MRTIILLSMILVLGMAVFAQNPDPKENTPGYYLQRKQGFPFTPVNSDNINPLHPNSQNLINGNVAQSTTRYHDSYFSPDFDATWANRFQTVLDSVVAATGVKGASLAILVPGQGLFTGVSGISSAGVPISRGMRFGFASNTKLFIAVTLEKLQEQGVLSLDDHLYQWLPSYSHVDSSATIRQLLSHQSGIFDFWNDNSNAFWNMILSDTARFWTPQEVLATIGAPHFAPGNGYRYSNTNYLLAGMVIEAATGTSWVQKLHDIIFNPLTMDSTFVGAYEPRNGPVAHEWVTNYGEVINSPMTSAYSATHASAAIESTPQEMAEWYSALFSGTIISSASLQEVLDFDPVSQYGLGIGEIILYNDHFCYAHGGAMIGCLSQMLYDVHTKSVLSVVTNQRVNNFGAILYPLINVLFNEYPRPQNDAGITKITSPWENSCSASVSPSVVLTNFGSAPLNTVDILYKIDGSTPLSFHWTGTLNSNDTANVVLPQITTVAGQHVFTCYTALPNGAPDVNTYNDTTKSNFIVNDPPSVLSVLHESFDGSTFPPAGWALSSSSMYQWGRTSLARFSGTGSAGKSNYNDYAVGAFYDLDLPLIHIANGTDPLLSFEYAYALYPGNYKDTLQVLISYDCGVTWQTLFNKGGLELYISTSTYYDYFPQSSSQWRQASVSLGAFPGDVLIRFRDVCGNGNNLFLDDVDISFPTGLAETRSPEKFTVYPNPATNAINVTGLPVNSDVQITDLSGKVLMTHQTSTPLTTLEIHQLPQGIYILRTALGVKKIVKM